MPKDRQCPGASLRLTALLAVVLAVVPTGCGQRPVVRTAPSDGPIRLTVWESYNNEEHEVFGDIVRQFETMFHKKHGKRIHVQLSRIPFDGLLPKLKTACQTRTTPDVCRVDVAHVVPLAYGKALVALDELENFPYSSLDDIRGRFVEAAIDSNLVATKTTSGRWKRHLYGLPDQTNCLCLFYNRTVLRRAGLSPDSVPRRWSDLAGLGRKINRPDAGVFTIGVRNTLWWTLPFFYSYGARFLTGVDGGYRCVLNEPAGLAALQFKVDLCRKLHDFGGKKATLEPGLWRSGAISPDQAFQNGLIAYVLNGPWNIRTFKRAGVDFGVSELPEGPAGSWSTVGGSNMVVFRSCPYPEHALEFLDYVTSDAVQVLWSERLGQIPVRKRALQVMIQRRDDPLMHPFYEQILRARARPRVPRYDVLEELANPEMELALAGDKTVKQALDDAVAKINGKVLEEIR